MISSSTPIDTGFGNDFLSLGNVRRVRDQLAKHGVDRFLAMHEVKGSFEIAADCILDDAEQHDALLARIAQRHADEEEGAAMSPEPFDLS